MEIILEGTEVHVLREVLEEVVSRYAGEIEMSVTPETMATLKERIRVLKAVVEKFPVEFAAV